MRVVVVGAGAAGAVASIFLARGGIDVVLLEKNEKIGKKLYITGKGRCNVTNDCEIQEFFGNIVHGEKFLRSAIYGFQPKDTMAFFEELSLSVATESFLCLKNPAILSERSQMRLSVCTWILD